MTVSNKPLQQRYVEQLFRLRRRQTTRPGRLASLAKRVASLKARLDEQEAAKQAALPDKLEPVEKEIILETKND